MLFSINQQTLVFQLKSSISKKSNKNLLTQQCVEHHLLNVWCVSSWGNTSGLQAEAREFDTWLYRLRIRRCGLWKDTHRNFQRTWSNYIPSLLNVVTRKKANIWTKRVGGTPVPDQTTKTTVNEGKQCLKTNEGFIFLAVEDKNSE